MKKEWCYCTHSPNTHTQNGKCNAETMGNPCECEKYEKDPLSDVQDGIKGNLQIAGILINEAIQQAQQEPERFAWNIITGGWQWFLLFILLLPIATYADNTYNYCTITNDQNMIKQFGNSTILYQNNKFITSYPIYGNSNGTHYNYFNWTLEQNRETRYYHDFINYLTKDKNPHAIRINCEANFTRWQQERYELDKYYIDVYGVKI